MTPSPLTNIIGTVLLVDYTEYRVYEYTHTLTQAVPYRSPQMSPHLALLLSLSPPPPPGLCSSVDHMPAQENTKYPHILPAA